MTITIAEIFGPTIQGEGPLIGRPSVFVRTGGCDDRCSWCDTLFAVDPLHKETWEGLEETEILNRVAALTGGKPVLVTVTGGNPALQPLQGFLERAKSQGHELALETQGSRAKDWFSLLDWLVLSPKPPSAGVSFEGDILADCVAAAGPQTHVVLKIVVMDEADYAFARSLAARFPSLQLFLQIGTPSPERDSNGEAMKMSFRQAAQWLARDKWFSVTLLPQLHLWAWGNERGR